MSKHQSSESSPEPTLFSLSGDESDDHIKPDSSSSLLVDAVAADRQIREEKSEGSVCGSCQGSRCPACDYKGYID